jgi:hypothetical protein
MTGIGLDDLRAFFQGFLAQCLADQGEGALGQTGGEWAQSEGVELQGDYDATR